MRCPALMCMPDPPDEAFSMATLAGVFFRAMCRLNDGDVGGVHFAYPEVARARPRGLPDDFTNLLDFGAHSTDAAARDRLATYVRRHGVRLLIGFDLAPVSLATRAARAAGAARVVVYSGAPLGTAVRPVRRLVKRAIIATAGPARADAIICESRAMAHLAVVSRGCPPSLLHVVPTGADVRRFHPAVAPDEAGYLRAVLGIPPDRTVVLFSGHTHERKGIGVLLDAAVELVDGRGRRDVQFVLCGNRRNEEAEWMARITGRAAAKFVRFGGYRADMPDVMRSADIGVLPTSGWDAMTLSVHEMAASGLPIVTTTVGGLPEAVVDGETGIVCPPGDPRALADAVARLVDDPALRRCLGDAGRARAVCEFSLDAQEDRIYHVLADLVGGAGAR